MATEYICDGCDTLLMDVERKRVSMNFFDAQPPTEFDLCLLCFMAVNPKSWKRPTESIVKELPNSNSVVGGDTTK